MTVDKCKVLLTENNYHHIKNYELSKISHEKDLGVTVSKDLNPVNIVSTFLRQLTK